MLYIFIVFKVDTYNGLAEVKWSQNEVIYFFNISETDNHSIGAPILNQRTDSM